MSTRDQLGSPDRFGYEWSTYTQILPESKNQLERWFGSTGLASCKDKRILDVGCGMGRNPYWMLKAGAKSVLAVDVDEGSLASARKNLEPFSNAEVDKCSVYDLDPRRLGLFDRVTCIGVLHHLQDPELALQKLWAMVEPGGDLILWCYAREGNGLILPLIQLFRSLGSKLPLPVAHGLAKLVTLIAWPFIHLIPWKTEYYRNLRALSFKNIESIIFDQFIPIIAHYWTRADMERLANTLPNARVTIEFVQGNSWHVRLGKTTSRGKLLEGDPLK